MTVAGIGYGSLFKVKVDGVYEAIGEMFGVTPPGVAVDSIDVFHEQSPDAHREFIPGPADARETSCEIHYVPTGTAEEQLYSFVRVTKECRNVFPSGAYVDYNAFITAMEPDTPIDDKMVMACTWKISGKPVRHAAATPSNSTKPAISGTAQVGVLLTAFDGVWANEPTSFTYQWEADGTPIGGATAKTYTPIIGQIGDVITCVVTGTNSAGSASAESAGTAAVIAA
ncbi:MAG: histidine kinase [Afipia sp.]|nr:histidine kinase [Afipia sp.]